MISLFFPLLAVISAYHFDVTANGDWKISGDEGAVLDSGHYMLCQNGECYNTINGELEIVPVQMHRYGEDVIGAYDESVFAMIAPPKGVEAHVYMRNYVELDTVVFGQHFYPTYPNMSMFDRDRVSTSFPSIKVPQTSDAYYINPCGYHTGWTDLRKGSWDQKNMTDMCGGLEGGPFFVFDQANYTRQYAGQFFAISSYSNFMVHNTQVTQNEYYNELWFGLMGNEFLNKNEIGNSYEMIKKLELR